MDHLPWYSQSSVSPVKVPFVCGDDPICGADDFLDFPRSQGWELGQSESLAQLARRAQAWLFFGLLAILGVSPDACVAKGTSSMAVPSINTSFLRNLINGPTPFLSEAFTRAEDILKWEVIPLLRTYEEEELLTLWTSTSYAILFSIDVLMDALVKTVRPRQPMNRRSRSMFPKRSAGVANSLLHVGKCGSLARRLGLNSSDLYHLMSLPGGLENMDHSQCGETSCNCFNVNRLTYRTRHTDDCDICEDGTEVCEAELVRLIRNNEVPMVRSTMNSDGKIEITITKMSMNVDYTAISHVWAGGLGNFTNNWIPYCQLKAIHQDVWDTTERASFEDGYRLPGSYAITVELFNYLEAQLPKWNPLRSTRTTCHYWLDTLCIPANHSAEREMAIGSMGRIYAGASSVLVLDPALSRIRYHDLGDESDCESRADLLIDASPWMARSWPLQEAALTPAIYVKFADGKQFYDHSRLGAAVTLNAIPNQEENKRHIIWSFDASFKSREIRAYDPSSDFIQVWNLLSKRTTSEPDDVPAIFAAILHKSAGEILRLQVNLRTRAIMGSMECLPLDVLCVQSQQDLVTNQMIDWAPLFPGSNTPVPLLDSKWGTLKRVASGFVVNLNNTEPTATRAVVCPAGLVTTSQSLLRDVHSKEKFLVHIDLPPMVSQSKAKDIAQDSRLLLLMLKEHPVNPLMNHGIICTIIADTRETVRVRMDNTIAWSSRTDHSLDASTVDCFIADASCSILIEMNLENWPSLKWSRLTAFPYQHLQAFSFRFEDNYVTMSLLIWGAVTCVPVISILLTVLFGWLISGDAPPKFIWLYTLFAFLGTLTRPLLAQLEGRHADTTSVRQARYTWATSFWDVDHAWLRPSWTISLNALLIDLGPATCLTSVLVYTCIKHPPSTEYFPDTFEGSWFFVILPFALEYNIRLAIHSYLQVQWMFSTLPYHKFLRRNMFVRFLSSWMSTNFVLACLAVFCLLIALGLAWGIFWIWLSIRNGEAQSPGYGYLIIFLLGMFLCFAFVCFVRFLRQLVEDTIWQARRTYRRNSWTREDTTPDGEIRLV